uniref:Uncharacterized protein n=1 Tax=viral metagenome TaxID=1070528 RepID=A0A6C0B8E9_9ZZZZ
MWADEINDPEYQDPVYYVDRGSTSSASTQLPDYKDLYYQPITSLNKRILNAITGEEYKYRIGSNDENRFYVVMTQDPFEPKEACRLFFANPQSYENFSGLKVSDESWARFRKNREHFRMLDSR